MTWLKNNRNEFLILLGATLTIFACILSTLSFYAIPIGIIDSSVLIEVAEIFTFAGTLLGIGGAAVSKSSINAKEISKLKEKIKLLEDLNEKDDEK